VQHEGAAVVRRGRECAHRTHPSFFRDRD
jgi:hypothetical protein